MKIFIHKCNNCLKNDLICLAEPYLSWYNEMDKAKQIRCDKMKFPQDRLMIIAGDHLARYALSDLTGLSTDKFHFSHDSHGKPILSDKSAYFNISHSGGFAAAIASDRPCGIDIEVPRKVRHSVLDHVCAPQEKAYIESSKDTQAAFLEIWTKKEAYFKSIGCGIATVLSFFNTLSEPSIYTTKTNDYTLSVYPYLNKEDIYVITK